MTDPTFFLNRNRQDRRGGVLPLVALLLPVLLILCGFAINLAHMQLSMTELKVVTDVTSHAGGRAMSEAQRSLGGSLSGAARRSEVVEQTYDQIETAATWNTVSGKHVTIQRSDENVLFGYSQRNENVQGEEMYTFNPVPAAQIAAGLERLSSVGVTASVELPYAFQVMSMSQFEPFRVSVATQVDRDIALVIDRSGSMLHYQDEHALNDAIEDLYEDTVRKRRQVRRRGRTYYVYYYERRISEEDKLRALGWLNLYEWWNTNNIGSWPEWYDTNGGLYYRTFSSDLRQEMYDLWTRSGNDQHKEMYEYMQDWENYAKNDWRTQSQYNALYDSGFMNHAPRHSRWTNLVAGVDAFLNVLGGDPDNPSTLGTPQKEMVSLTTFSNVDTGANIPAARVDVALTDDDILHGGTAYYQNIRDVIADIVPLGGTSIGDGLSSGLPPIIDPDWAEDNNMSGAAARPFAEKTIVVLTDGQNNHGAPDPEQTVIDMLDEAQQPVTIHAVTFTVNADKVAMGKVAKAGGGKAYHADNGSALVGIFEEIANNLPTILTDGYEKTAGTLIGPHVPKGHPDAIVEIDYDD
jgi:Mg-chelatase subunit ChlD/Flp pilus assembly protein TadG